MSPGYDTAGREISVSTTVPGLGTKTAKYQLGPRGYRKQLKWPDGYIVNYTNDAVGRMATATDGSGTALATYVYDDFSHLQSVTYANGASMAYNFDITGDLLSLTNDMAGTANDVTYTLGYTAAHELSSEKISNSGYVFQPSKNGAGTDTYGTPNNLNQYVNVTLGGQALTFRNDNDGNLKNDGINVYLYDPENHLMTTNTGFNGTWNYAYDPKGRRTTKSGTSTTYFLNDGDDEIAEYDGSGNLLTRYVPGAEIDQPIAKVPASGSNEYFHTDHHGTVVATSDSNENLDEGPFLYDAYGYCGTTCAGGEPFKYVGRYLDAETGLYYNRARYYSPQIGRFNQTDPVGYASDMDLYTYVLNDPTNRTDPTGMYDDVVGTGPSAVQEEQVLNSPAGRQGELLGAAIGIGIGVGAAVCVEGGCQAAGAAVAKWAKSPSDFSKLRKAASLAWRLYKGTVHPNMTPPEQYTPPSRPPTTVLEPISPPSSSPPSGEPPVGPEPTNKPNMPNKPESPPSGAQGSSSKGSGRSENFGKTIRMEGTRIDCPPGQSTC